MNQYLDQLNISNNSIKLHSAIENGKRTSWNQSEYERCAAQTVRMSLMDSPLFDILLAFAMLDIDFSHKN